MGFNALQIEEGFYVTPAGQRPFTPRAIADCFAEKVPNSFLEHQKAALASLAEYCPGEFLSGLWVMDSVHVHGPNGAHIDAHALSVCVLGVWQDSVVWPLLWAFVHESMNETKVGKKVVVAAEEMLGEGTIRHLLIDRGLVTGPGSPSCASAGRRSPSA